MHNCMPPRNCIWGTGALQFRSIQPCDILHVHIDATMSTLQYYTIPLHRGSVVYLHGLPTEMVFDVCWEITNVIRNKIKNKYKNR